MQRLGPEGLQKGLQDDLCMDNSGRQKKSLTNSLRGKIRSHDDLEISLILETGQLKQISKRSKPANRYCFSSPTSCPSACVQPPVHRGQSIPSQKIQKPNTTERKKTLLWVLTGREGPGSPEAPEYHSITRTHGDPPERIRAVNSSKGNARHPLLRGAVGCCSASELPLVSLPGTTHHRVLQITCPASFLTP